MFNTIKVPQISTQSAVMLILSLAVILSTTVFTRVNMHYQRNLVMEKADARLFTAAEMFNQVLGEDYHNNLMDNSSLSDEAFLQIVDNNDRLCRRLSLQYLWSVLVLDDNTKVFTSATRTDIHDPRSGHARFFEVHNDPDAFIPALKAAPETPVYSTFRNEWGIGRMVLIPRHDMHGRTYIIGASVQLTELKSRLNQTMITSIFMGAIIFVMVILLSLLFVRRLTLPIARLTASARRMASGDLDVPLEISGTHELQSLALSFDQMRQGLKQYITMLEESKEREQTENKILKRISKREPLERILKDVALFGEQLDPKIKASILLYDENRKVLYHAAAPSLPEDYNALLRPGLPIGPEVGSCGSAAFHQQLVIAEDIANSHRWMPYTDFIEKTAKHGLKACWSQPFFSSDGKLLGTIANYSNQTGKPTSSNLKVLEWSTRIAGLAVEQDIAEKELITAKLTAEENNKLKTAFLQNMSHEIRTPLNGIMGFCSLLKNYRNVSDEKKIDEYINIIVSSSNRLLAIINDVLEISHIESGLLKENKAIFQLDEVVTYAHNMFLEKAKAKGLVFETSIRGNLAAEKLYTDKDKLLQIVSNLLNNAIKFTHEGKIELFVERHQTGVSISVTDTGIGISPKFHEHIFERFWQQEAFTKDFYGGTGLGLSISKGLADFLGMRINVNSDEGKGSMFSIIIPHALIVNDDKTELTNKSTGKVRDLSLKGYKFLIAEDDQTSYMYIADILEKAGASHKWVMDGQAAIDMVNRERFDAVIMDIKMPIMDGLQATRAIKVRYPTLPILAQTAHASIEDEEEAKKSACDACIKKPFEQKDLLERLLQLVDS